MHTTSEHGIKIEDLQNHSPINITKYGTSVMIIIVGASLSEQHTDLLICHCTKQDLSCTSRYQGITYDKPTARRATVSVSTYTRTKLYNKVISCISDVISAVYADGPYLKRPQPPS